MVGQAILATVLLLASTSTVDSASSGSKKGTTVPLCGPPGTVLRHYDPRQMSWSSLFLCHPCLDPFVLGFAEGFSFPFAIPRLQFSFLAPIGLLGGGNGPCWPCLPAAKMNLHRLIGEKPAAPSSPSTQNPATPS